eukprot:4242242-Amphidinium_carterae.1
MCARADIAHCSERQISSKLMCPSLLHLFYFVAFSIDDSNKPRYENLIHDMQDINVHSKQDCQNLGAHNVQDLV